MKFKNETRFSQSVMIFHGIALPAKDGTLAGYAALINAYELKVPIPETLSFISTQHKRYKLEVWEVYTLRHKPEETLGGHLTFALKYEGLDLAVLNALFQKIDETELEVWVKSEPSGRYSRRIWFLYEWLTGKTLAVTDVNTGNFFDALNTKLQFGGTVELSRRHRIRNNLPGSKDFCPLVRRTKKLEQYLALDLATMAHTKTKAVHPNVLSRAAAFLLLKDSRASFAIEGETIGKNRAERWGKVVAQAGLTPLSLEDLLRIQAIVIEDSRFVKLGLRKEGGFIGVHERSTQQPLPDHISANWQDLPRLMLGMSNTHNQLNKKETLDPVILAAIIAFGFVFIHPFVDGNGRIHRYLIHHVLADLGFSPKGIVFPVSAVILERIDEYRLVLESYSRPRLEFIDWQPTEGGNIDILNETIDLYRYFDATKMAEFLYDCVQETIEKVLPEEIRYLECYDEMKNVINELFDMPDHLADLLINFLEQNKGKLSKRAKEKEFQALSEKECESLEKSYSLIFTPIE